jgi:hypothetical protein
MRYVLPAFLVLALLAMPSCAEKDVAPFVPSDAVLAKLPGVELVIEGATKGGKEIGVTPDGARRVAELVLGQSRIPLLTREQRDAAAGQPVLYVNVNVVGDAYAISVALLETVRLDRRRATVSAETWSVSGAGTHGGSRQFVLDAVRRQVEMFALDWLKQNGDPKKAKRAPKSAGK